MQLVAPLRMNGNYLYDFGFQALASAPSTYMTIGRAYYDTVANAPRFYNGTTWDLKATDSALLGGSAGSFYLSRTNHTGSQTASTISDLATVVKAYKLSDFAAPVANVAMGGFTLTGLNTAPNASGQAAEYSWVLNQISASAGGTNIKSIKDPVRVLFTTNQAALSGIPTSGNADNVTLSAGDRVLLTGQTTTSQNGIWLVQSGAWTRPTDYTGATTVEPGTEVLVNEGTANGGTVWRISTTTAITVDTTGTAWQQINKINTYSNGNGLSLTGTVFAVVAVASGGITVSGSGVAVDRTLVPMRYSVLIGDGAALSYVVTHNLNQLDCMVVVREVSTGNIVYPDVTLSGVNTCTVAFGSAPASNAYKVTVIG